MDKSEAERLAERLRELLANAGLPWRVNAGAIGVNPWIESSNGTKLDGEYRRGGCILNMVAHDERENDAALIVEAVNALPTLLARIAAMKSAIQHVLDMCPATCFAPQATMRRTSQRERLCLRS